MQLWRAVAVVSLFLLTGAAGVGCGKKGEEGFRKFQAALARLGELQSSTLDSQDVTEEFYDLKTRIKNREAAEESLREMYKKATKIDEMIPINDKIREVRLEIEREQGRLQLLTKLTEMTTVTVRMYERGSF